MEGSALKKRKRFHGNSCQKTRGIISDVMDVQQLSMESFEETSNPDAFLCHVCDQQGDKLHELQQKAHKIKKDFLEKLSQLTKVHESSSSNRGQKRVAQLQQQGANKRLCPVSKRTITDEEIHIRDSDATLCNDSINVVS